jgi:hypothetical protein
LAFDCALKVSRDAYYTVSKAFRARGANSDFYILQLLQLLNSCNSSDMILRTPKYESFLEEWERGASVSFDRDRRGDEEVVLLREVVYAPDGKRITLRTDHQTYQLDVGKVDPSELSAMCGAFRMMNFDSSIRLTGV